MPYSKPMIAAHQLFPVLSRLLPCLGELKIEAFIEFFCIRKPVVQLHSSSSTDRGNGKNRFFCLP